MNRIRHERPIAAVTGASGGLGRALVCRLADDGYDVGLIAQVCRARVHGVVAQRAVGRRQRRTCRAGAHAGDGHTPVRLVPDPNRHAPEQCADAVMRAVDGGRRQKIFGVWNWFLVKLNSVMPGVGDHYMARTGFDSQLTDIPIDPDRPDSL